MLDWWNSEFTSQESTYIEKKYILMGSCGLTKGQILESSASSVNFLTGLQSWFNTLSDKAISEKILIRADQLVSSNTPTLDVHFLNSAIIEHYYKTPKLNSLFYELAISYCQKQIELCVKSRTEFLNEFGSLPGHAGYEQLAIIFEKEYNFDAALKICFQAKEQGWNSDWDKRISRLETKLKR